MTNYLDSTRLISPLKSFLVRRGEILFNFIILVTAVFLITFTWLTLTGQVFIPSNTIIFLKASFHHDYTKLYRNDYIFLKLELQAFHLI